MEEQSILFIELDALMDTRIGVFSKFEPEAVEKVMKNKYWDRQFDYFEGIDNARFRSLYEQRDKSVLANSVITPLMMFLKEFCFSTIEASNNTPFKKIPVILINTYPYVLSDKEQKTIQQAVFSSIAGMADVKLVHMSHEQVTPKYVKVNLSVMILYQYDKWLELHCANENFKHVTCPEVTLIGPRISFREPGPDVKVTDEAFESIRTIAGPLVNLILLPVENFSVVRPKKKS